VINGFTITRGGSYTGGGVRVFDNSDVEIYDNIFLANVTDFEGAGITVQRMSRSFIHDNEFRNNVSFRTSAITVIVNSSAQITGNFFLRNRSADLASCIGVNASSVDIGWNRFVDNHSGNHGGTIDPYNSSATIYNNTFIRNLSPSGASCIRSTGSVSAHNNLFAHNGGPAVSLADCTGFSCNYFYDNIQDVGSGCDPIGVNGNLNIDTMVCNPGANNCAVSMHSPCLTGPCGLVGVNPEYGCIDDVVPSEPTSWGSLKALYG